MSNKFYDKQIWITFSSKEEEEAYAERQKNCNLQRVERTPEMKAYIKKSLQYMYSITSEEGKQNIDNLLKNIDWLQEEGFQLEEQ